MKELAKLIYDEMRVVEIWNPVTDEYWYFSGEEKGVLIRKGGKIMAYSASIEDAAKFLAVIYHDFIERMDFYLNALKNGKSRYWEFANHFGVEVMVGFGSETDPDDQKWFVVCGGDLAFTSPALEEVAEYLKEEHLNFDETLPPIKSLDDPRLMPSQEAAEKWGFDPVNIREPENRKKFPPGTIRKFGRQWVVLEEGMYYVFGMPKGKDPTYEQYKAQVHQPRNRLKKHNSLNEKN
jgi:Helix-turn-helix domain